MPQTKRRKARLKGAKVPTRSSSDIETAAYLKKLKNGMDEALTEEVRTTFVGMHVVVRGGRLGVVTALDFDVASFW